MFSLTRSVVRAAFSSSRGEGLIPLGAALLAPGAAALDCAAYLASQAANALAALRRTLAGWLRQLAERLDPPVMRIRTTEAVPTESEIDAKYVQWCDEQEAEMAAREFHEDSTDDGTALSEFHAAAETAVETPTIAQDAPEAPDGRDIVQAVSLAVALKRLQAMDACNYDPRLDCYREALAEAVKGAGSIRGAARALGMPESTLRRRLTRAAVVGDDGPRSRPAKIRRA